MSLLNFRMKLLRQKRVQRHFKLSIFDNFVAQLLIHHIPVHAQFLPDMAQQESAQGRMFRGS
jgi:hypothetical protein